AAGGWRTVLVGSTGAGGGKRRAGGGTVSAGSVFALDVSTPGSFDADDVLWELSGDDHDDLGFVLGRPHIVPVKGSSGPRWVALFGNGPNSANGAPVLFVVDLESGRVHRALKPPGDGHAGKIGLMLIAPGALGNSVWLVVSVFGGDLYGIGMQYGHTV